VFPFLTVQFYVAWAFRHYRIGDAGTVEVGRVLHDAMELELHAQFDFPTKTVDLVAPQAILTVKSPSLRDPSFNNEINELRRRSAPGPHAD